MRILLPFLPIYLAGIPLFVYIMKHEKEHTRLWLLVKQLCTKAHIDNGE